MPQEWRSPSLLFARRTVGPHLNLRRPVVCMTIPNPDSVGHFVLVGDAPQDLLTASGISVAEASVILIIIAAAVLVATTLNNNLVNQLKAMSNELKAMSDKTDTRLKAVSGYERQD